MENFFCRVISLLVHIHFVFGIELVAYISQNGLHGEILFKKYNSTSVEIRANLETTLQFPDQIWSWGVHKLPVDYTEIDPKLRCSPSTVGDNLISFDEDLGYLTLPGNESSTWLANVQITGDKGIWGKSLVLWNTYFRICATITTRDASLEHSAEARFAAPASGSIYFRWLAAKDHSDTLIYSNLFHIHQISTKIGFTDSTEHYWKIYATDIFENDHHRSEDNCNFLQLVFDPEGRGEGNSTGDIDARVGKIKVAMNPIQKLERQLFRDEKLVLLPSDLSIPHRTLYVVIFDALHHNNFFACAKIRHIKPILLKSFINGKSLKGEVTFKQRSKFDPTFLNVSVASASNHPDENLQFARDISAFRVTELPPSPNQAGTEKYCATAGNILNPRGIEYTERTPPPGLGTQDQYAVGDLSGKLQGRSKSYYHKFILPGSSSELNGVYWDVFLPLQGPASIAHRGFLLRKHFRPNSKNVTEIDWTCGSIMHYSRNGIHEKAIFTAQVLFRYPLVGRVLFKQLRDERWADTSIIIEYLVHADGSALNNSEAHRWAIHAEPPGRDFYNWSDRCLSAGEVFNPYKIDFDMKTPEEKCKSWMPGLCRVGDLFNRLGSLSIAGGRRNATVISRKFFTDSYLPLSGPHNILGKSLVLFDDFGPKFRGERLACSIIGGHYRRKAVAKDWYANGFPLTIKGKLEIVQQSEYDLSNVEVQFKGLDMNSGYHIHMTPVESNLEFPCEDSSLYGHWNPWNVNPRKSPMPGTGSSDEYEMGDLSGKFGTLDELKQYEDAFNDTNLPLFGYESITGRSVVIHKKKDNTRWACSTLERGYSPSEAREIRGIASFHHPSGYAYGYMRMTQLIYNDGSASDTIIEVKLRYPGKNDRNMTRNHHWQIFVNPVGVDAAVKQTATRCVAGGYVWNPYYTQLADPLNTELYSRECGPDNPLRCYVGDVSARLGTIDLGLKRVVFADPNFPLEGTVSAIGRSIVIFGPERSHERFACANIEPDHNIIKYINLEKPPQFVVAQFLDDIRQIMGIPEWMLDVDARRTKTLHNGGCIQLVMHFKGPIAHRLELDFSRLISTGRLSEPSLSIAGYINPKRKSKASFRTCGVRDPNEKKKTFFSWGSSGASRNLPNSWFSIIPTVSLINCIIVHWSVKMHLF